MKRERERERERERVEIHSMASALVWWLSKPTDDQEVVSLNPDTVY